MNEVRLSTEKYDALQHCIQAKAARTDALEKELVKVKEAHEEEIKKMADEGKVRSIGIKINDPIFQDIFKDISTEEKEYRGFDDVKAEVTEHFKQGLFDEEFKKYKEEQFSALKKTISEQEVIIQDLRSQIARLESRSLIERICNR